VYPGSFDPVHYGHLDIVERAREVFGVVVIGVAKNIAKKTMFSAADRVAMLKAATSGIGGVEVRAFDGLTVEFAHAVGARVIVKGLRATMDFEFELKMAAMNKRLRPEVDTVFMMTNPQFGFLSSTLIREVAQFGGSVDGLVPPPVARRLRQKLKSRPAR
jgi:pantetheine-phosphate adenylyltransferase